MAAALIYSVDFTALPNQAVSAGANTIDGRTWYAKGNASQNGNTYTRNLVNGSGLSILTANANAAIIGAAGDLDFPHWVLPLSQIPNYDAAEPHLFQARYGFVGGTSAYLGLCDTTLDGTGLRAAARAKDHLVGIDATSPSTNLWTKLGANGINAAMLARTGSIARTSQVLGLRTLAPGAYALVGNESLASGMPAAPDTFLPGQAVATGSDPFFTVSRTVPCLFFGFQNQLGQAHGIYLQRLQVWRLSAVPVVPDTTPPVVDSFVPAPGNIGQQQVLQFDVSDDSVLAGCVVMVRYGLVPPSTKRGYDVVYDGVEFADYYKGRSSVEQLTATRWRFKILRDGGWPTPPRVTVFAADGRVAA